uniref:RING-type E3 ubiquitin transferase n=1 Tax=Timema shepardi TaxID=629360 RepID=A0A7R9AMC5_TIMSH|nr:unnamed protein product [Timema shepardi]
MEANEDLESNVGLHVQGQIPDLLPLSLALTAESQAQSQRESSDTEVASSATGAIASGLCLGSVQSSQDSPTKGIKRKSDFEENNDDDGNVCPICLSEWTNSGKHRLVSLRCGHLFGQNCIERWLQIGCAPGQKRCPQCNEKANSSHIRPIYARKLVVIDTTEIDRLREKLDEITTIKSRLQFELVHANLSRQHLEEQLNKLKQENKELKTSSLSDTNSLPSIPLSQNKRLHMMIRANEIICKEGGCRVLAFNEWLNLLVVSQCSTNRLFSGYGIRKINALDFRPTQFAFLHQKPIRDMTFQPHQNKLLLSVSLDRCAKLFDMTSNSVVQIYNADNPLWSCCWDEGNPYKFFAGSQNGKVLEYDTRRVGDLVGRAVEGGDTSPVVSLASFPPSPGRALSRGGFFACRLNSCWAYELQDDGYSSQLLPFQGPFFSLFYDKSTDHLLVSSRPSERFPSTRHMLHQMIQSNDSSNGQVCSPVDTFSGGNSQKLLSRPTLMSLQGGTMVAAHDESSRSVVVWDVASRLRLYKHQIQESVVDLCYFQVNTSQYLANLTEKNLQILEFK